MVLTVALENTSRLNPFSVAAKGSKNDPGTNQTKPNFAKVLGNINFRLLWIGQGTSLLGDQFFLIGIPRFKYQVD
jgi:hypothetical protein